jgi:ABC-2 type transport system permease protein
MSGFLNHFLISLRLNFRNIQALVFGYFVPVFFLFAFKGLYASLPPLMKEFGQLLTISTLGGACFGLPVTLVSERDRGVWRRYRLAPMPTAGFVASLMAARFVMIASSALVLLGLAMLCGMPAPARPLELFGAYAAVAFAFLSVGLVIAMLANSAGAVQALGQCLFLPMIIIGGVGVKIEMLPAWARHVAAYLPSHYAVRVLTACTVTKGAGLQSPQSIFDLILLFVIGISCCFITVKLFRWEPDQKRSLGAKAWAILALAVWVAAGVVAEHYKLS